MLINLVNTKYALNHTWFPGDETAVDIDHFMHSSVLWSSNDQTDRTKGMGDTEAKGVSYLEQSPP
jgi:hypothetical protein